MIFKQYVFLYYSKLKSLGSRVLPEATIYVYDNNSNDGSDKIAKNAGAIVSYEFQQGKGNVIRRMFQELSLIHI